MNQRTYTAIGTMSGTSMDGVDVAMIRTNGMDQIESLGHVSLDYPSRLRSQLKEMASAARTCEGDLQQAQQQCEHWQATLQQLTQYHADAISQLLQRYPNQVDVIGFHGQTLYHAPHQHMTVQVGLSDWLAKQFAIPLVHQFRLHDVQAGGQGAPLAPVYHQALVLRDQLAPAVVINCGGIMNATVVTGEGWEQLLASDLGPGSALIDRLVTAVSQGKLHFDQDGCYAKQGRLNQALLDELWQSAIKGDSRAFVAQSWPKSLDIHDLVLPEGIAKDQQQLCDACFTLLQFSAESLVDGLRPMLKIHPEHFILCGGGWNNPALLQCFTEQVQRWWPQAQVQLSHQYNWHTQAVEAEIFAYLAVRHLLDLPASGPSTTGVPVPCVAGRLVK